MFNAKEHLPEIHGVKDSPPCWVEEPWTITSLGSPNRSNTRSGRTTDARGWNLGPKDSKPFQICFVQIHTMIWYPQSANSYCDLPTFQAKKNKSPLGPKKITPRPRRLLGHGDALLHLDLISRAIKDLIGSLCTTGIVLATRSSGTWSFSKNVGLGPIWVQKGESLPLKSLKC